MHSGSQKPDSFHQAVNDAEQGSQGERSALPTAASCAGWQLVPIEPTPEMIAAAAIAVLPNPNAADFELSRAAARIIMADPRTPPSATLEAIASAMATIIPAHRAMLAAAPTPLRQAAPVSQAQGASTVNPAREVTRPDEQEWLLYEHEDGRYAVAVSGEAAFASGDPKWHRLGPVTLTGRPAAWPIIKATVKHGNVQTASLYAPGLPDGEYDLWLPESRAAREGALPDDKDAARYRAFFDWLPVCFRGEEYYSKAECDAAIDAKTGALK